MTDPISLNAPVMLCGQELVEPRPVVLKTGQAIVFSRAHSGQSGGNEDALGVFEDADGRVCLVVADGVGGLPGGLEAATLATGLLAKVSPSKETSPESRLESINQRLLTELPNSATTVCVAEIADSVLVNCHAGDSTALVVGQRGRIKLKTQAHSPVGIKEANGLDEKEALFHPQRHLLNNMMGDPALWLEKQNALELASRDTVLLGTDGLWDNFFLSEVVDLIRMGELSESAGKLAEIVIQRMDQPVAGLPSKPDDISFILYRPSVNNGADTETED